jgi:hypothetical protein
MVSPLDFQSGNAGSIPVGAMQYVGKCQPNQSEGFMPTIRKQGETKAAKPASSSKRQKSAPVTSKLERTFGRERDPGGNGGIRFIEQSTNGGPEVFGKPYLTQDAEAKLGGGKRVTGLRVTVEPLFDAELDLTD